MQKEKQVEEYFYPVMYRKKQHEYLRQSLQEDYHNYGIWKTKEGLQKQAFKARREQEQEDIEIGPQKSIRPMTALISPSHSYSSRQRPITAPGLNVQVKHMMKIDENEAMISVPYHSEAKHFRNTKTLDKSNLFCISYQIANQKVIRNNSTLKKVSLEGESEIYVIEDEEAKNQNIIEKQTVKSSLFSPKQSEQQLTGGFHQNTTIIKGAQHQQRLFKHSSLQIYDNLAEIMKLINGQTYTKSPVIVKTKPQGLRPQSAVNKQVKVSQRYRPVSGKVQSITVRGIQL
ncbi:unnamed protein product (macronuclear) [Paramecium tetraurelia]|uniref:Uncharacterized protein n=1 Tax=Paramecium tetraurelia TaxID=5888 RepID=A0C886_PARTE|nr:uncharacterized protein GSPATT00036134001 [Paramecium tetraurelia]CAK67003.1 unnamed protein product [Paramecium tetraurelia]|eukprot:XP_001434400.1 hypothetical protein (macronuclear) [Paramecium tetraurelia strain d4-2]